MDWCKPGAGEWGRYGWEWYCQPPFYPPYQFYPQDYRHYHGHGYYDYHHHPQHQHNLLDQQLHIEYGAGAGGASGGGGGGGGRESRGRRAAAAARRDSERYRLPAHLPAVSPVECPPVHSRSMYCEPQPAWHQYQVGGAGPWTSWKDPGWSNPIRDVRRSPSSDHAKGHQVSPVGHQSDRELHHMPATFASGTFENGYSVSSQPGPADLALHGRVLPAAARPIAPPTTVPLPAFQQAFGSTEIGKFSEAFTRAEAAHEADCLPDSYSEWDISTEPNWPLSKDIKCEEGAATTASF